MGNGFVVIRHDRFEWNKAFEDVEYSSSYRILKYTYEYIYIVIRVNDISPCKEVANVI